MAIAQRYVDMPFCMTSAPPTAKEWAVFLAHRPNRAKLFRLLAERIQQKIATDTSFAGLTFIIDGLVQPMQVDFFFLCPVARSPMLMSVLIQI